MIGYLKGKVLYSDAGTVLLENNGVGYELLCSGALFAKLVNEKQGEAYTYLQVREDGLSLFGFVSPEEKNMFLKLITVSGVGPKMGIAILSAMNINDIAVAIATRGTCARFGRKAGGACRKTFGQGRGRRRGTHVPRLHPCGEYAGGARRAGKGRADAGGHHHDCPQKYVTIRGGRGHEL